MARKWTTPRKTRVLGQRMPPKGGSNQRNARQRQDIVQWAAEVNNQGQQNSNEQGQLQETRVPPISDGAEQGPTFLPDGRNGDFDFYILSIRGRHCEFNFLELAMKINLENHLKQISLAHERRWLLYLLSDGFRRFCQLVESRQPALPNR